jgi:hypothetical protein
MKNPPKTIDVKRPRVLFAAVLASPDIAFLAFFRPLQN